MKKFVVAVCVAVLMPLVSVITADAKNVVVDNELSVILDECAKENGVTAVRVQGGLLNMARTLAGKETKALMKCLDLMYMCYAGKASDEAKAMVVSAVNTYFADKEAVYKKEVAEVEDPSGAKGSVVTWFRMDGDDTIVEIVTFSEAMSTVMILTGTIPISLIGESMTMFNEQRSQD